SICLPVVGAGSVEDKVIPGTIILLRCTQPYAHIAVAPVDSPWLRLLHVAARPPEYQSQRLRAPVLSPPSHIVRPSHITSRRGYTSVSNVATLASVIESR